MAGRDSSENPGVAAALAYGLFQFPVGLLVPPLTLMLPSFFAETMGVPLALVGGVAGVARLIHLASDPLTGALSDHTRTPIGRRRPWILAGVVMALISVWLLFAPPVARATPAYLAGGLALLYLATSFIQIPYYAWGAEYPATPFGRARMLGIREVAGLAGLLLSGAAPLLASAAGYPANGRAAMAGLAVGLGVMIPATAALLLLASPEPPAAAAETRRPTLAETLRDFWNAAAHNRAYRVCLIGFQTVNIGVGVGQSISYFFLSRILHMPQLFGLLLLIGGLCAVVSAPFWIALSKRFELKWIVGLAIVGSALTHTIGFLLLGPGQPIPLIAVETVQAVLLAPAIILAPTLQALAIEQGTLDSGADRAGTYVALSQLVSQVANAAPFILLFPLLALAGFEPSAPASSATGLSALRLAGIFAAAPFQILGALVVLTFPISRRQAAANAERIAARGASA
jgi:Na+/melibiose symporter-like transporter